MIFVSVDSKKLSFSVSPLFSTLTGKSTSVDFKGLALRENCAKSVPLVHVQKDRGAGRRDLIPRLTRSGGNRAGVPECDYTYGLLKVNGGFSGDQWMYLAVAWQS